MYKKIDEFYNKIFDYPRLSQDEVVSLYQQENITKLSFQQQLDTINATLSDMSLSEEDEQKAQLEQQKEEIQYKIQQEKDVLYFSSIGSRVSHRNYPSADLQYQMFMSHLYLVRGISKKFYFHKTCKESYDDIFQVGSMGLWSACKYYVPSNKGKFTTYASVCIKNSINRFLYPKKKKKYKQTLEKEREQIHLVQLFLQSTIRSYYSPFNHRLINDFLVDTRASLSSILYRFNKKVHEFNYELLCLGRNPYANPLRGKKSISEKYDEIVTMLSNFLTHSLLKNLITDEDRELISLLASYRNIPQDQQHLFYLREYLFIYLRKLEDIELYLEIFTQYTKENNGIIPSEEYVLQEMNKKVEKFNREIHYYRWKKKHPNLQPPTEETKSAGVDYQYPIFYNEEYFNQFGIHSLASDYFESKDYEREMITEEIQNKIDSLDEILDTIDEYDDEDFLVLHEDEYGYDIDMAEEETEGVSASILKEKLCILKEKLETDIDCEVNRVLESRKKSVQELVQEQNPPKYEYNKKVKHNRKASTATRYQPYYTEESLKNINQDITLLLDTDEELSLFGYRADYAKKQPHTTVEEEVLEHAFLEDYYRALQTLSPMEQQVLQLWLDEEGKHCHTAQEIGKELHIAPVKVYQIKQKALHKLSQNEQLQSYIE